MREGNHRRLVEFSVAVVAVGAALAVRALLNPVLGDHLPFATFYVAVVVASWHSGLVGGLLATALGFGCAFFFFVPPQNSAVGVSDEHLVGLAMYFMVSLAIAGFGGAMRQAQRRSRYDHEVADTQARQAAQLRDDLRKRVEELDALLQLLPVGVFVAHDPECTHISMNPAGAEMLGLKTGANASKTGPTADQLPFRVFKDGKEVPNEDLSMQRAARTREMVRGEVVDVVRNDGVTSTLYEYAVPLFDEGGRLRGCLGAFVDITDRKRAEAALAESERRFKTLASHAPVGIFQTDAEGNCLFVNERWQEMAGLAQEEARGQGWVQALHPDDRDRVRQEWYEAANVGREFASEYRFQSRDGVVTWLSGLAIALRDESGKIVGHIGTVTDITQQKRAGETVRSLLRISERLNSTLDVEELLDILVQEAIALVDAESGVAGLRTTAGMVSKRYFQRGEALPLEYCWPPMYGLPGWLIVHKEPYLTNDAANDNQIIRQLCEQFGVRSALSTPIISAEGEVIGFFEIHNKRDAAGFTLEDQKMLVSVAQAAAIAVQNALAYRRLRQTQESLQESDRRKDEFLATLAHELRNPLAPLRNGLELMRLADGDKAMADEARTMMERQLQQMVRLIDDLLDVSRISRGKLNLHKSRVRLDEVIRSAIETCRPTAEAAGHQLEVSLPEQAVYLDADATRLAQAFSNLLSNACKYTESGGRVSLVAERQGSDIVVTVSDNGLGIPPQMLDRIFDMFTQVDGSLERSHDGLGIGLTIVKRLIEMHDGHIEARSEGPGKGSEFIVRLPISLTSPVEETSPAEGAQTGLSARRRILVVDDNRDSAMSLGLLLKATGNEIATAHDGQQAIEIAESFRPNVILMDIGMPKLNGYDAAMHIRQQPWGADMVLIALSGWGQEEDKRRTKEAGFNHHLIKPVEPALLEKTLEVLVAPTG